MISRSMGKCAKAQQCSNGFLNVKSLIEIYFLDNKNEIEPIFTILDFDHFTILTRYLSEDLTWKIDLEKSD